MDLERLSDNELRVLQTKAGNIICERRNKQQKELWGNVVAAIEKYQELMGQEVLVNIDCGSDEGYFRMEDTANNPGTLYVGIAY